MNVAVANLAVALAITVAVASTSASPADAAPPSSPGGAVCTGGVAQPTRIEGRVAPLAAGSTPSVVEILPATDMTRAYLQQLRFTLATGSAREAATEQLRSDAGRKWTSYLAMHQAQIVEMTKYAHPTGDRFRCTGFAPGTYYLIVIAQRHVALGKPYRDYASGTTQTEVYAAQATLSAKPAADVTPFVRLGTYGT